ncbi:MAG: nucleotidyltransferase family protein [Caldilineaceae bacterium]|nr:nucleotidyltransferase family protein [Caldilineaceae bacterium]
MSNTSPLSPSSELRILLAVGHLQLTDRQQSELSALLQENIHWERLFRLGDVHGMLPLLAYHLSDARLDKATHGMPGKILEAIRAARRINAARALQLGMELDRIGALFAERQIPVMPYKGIMLARRWYGDETLRQTGDIDLIVAQSDLCAARELLTHAGYVPAIEFDSVEQEQAFVTQTCHYLYTHPAQQVSLELHWDIVRRHDGVQFDWDAIQERAQSIIPWSLPAQEDLLLILAYHGGKHRWSILKWLTDIAMVSENAAEINWPRVLASARSANMSRAMHVSLAASHRLLQVDYPESVLSAIEEDRAIDSLIAAILAALEKPTQYAWNSAALLNFNLRLRSSWTDKAAYLWGVVGKPNFQDVREAETFRFSHYFRRLGRLAGKYHLLQRVSRK